MNSPAGTATADKPALLEFSKPKPEDAQWVRPMLFAANRMGCEYCFGNTIAWHKTYGTEIAQAEGVFFARSTRKGKDGTQKVAYGYPVGTGIGDAGNLDALKQAILLLKEDAQEKPLHLYGLEAQDIPLMEAAFPGKFTFSLDRAICDYIYLQSDLANLAGKKYHGKRNHISRFLKDNSDWSYEEITPNTMDECLAMAERWKELHADRDPQGLEEEFQALRRVFALCDDCGLRGGLLRAGGEVIAFTVGEPLNERCFVTHFEKAYPSIPGAYPMINRCFAEHTLAGYEYINREEDLGNEGLRKAKLSYHPAMLLEKYRAKEIVEPMEPVETV